MKPRAASKSVKIRSVVLEPGDRLTIVRRGDPVHGYDFLDGLERRLARQKPKPGAETARQAIDRIRERG